MPIKKIAPIPKFYPCTIGVDYWHERHPDTKKINQFFYKYTDAQMDCDGWADPGVWLPLPFDLCRLKTQRHAINGWWTGKDWESLRLKKDDKVLFWKRIPEETS